VIGWIIQAMILLPVLFWLGAVPEPS
jgi:hypothetical protein